MTHSQSGGLKGAPKEKNNSQHVTSQNSCMLLQLPGEIRNLIYSHLFAETILTFSTLRVIPNSTIRAEPTSNSLAILRTCSLINQEARGLWLGQVLFDFEYLELMLGSFSVRPVTTISQIRHVRVTGETMMLKPRGGGGPVYYRLAQVLELLPDLCLDTLTVISDSSGLTAYDTVDGLVKQGNGWKTLHFITRNSEMLGFKKTVMMSTYWRKPQPSTWNNILTQRDSPDSGASVTIYRSTQSEGVLVPETRQLFEQKPPPPEDLDMFGLEEDKQLLDTNERWKELLVVVKRGRGAHISEQDSPRYSSEGDIQQWTQGMNWAEIRRRCRDLPEFDINDHPADDYDMSWRFYTPPRNVELGDAELERDIWNDAY